MAIRVTRATQATPKPPTYYEYRTGVTYNEDTFPPAPRALQAQAVAEGWAEWIPVAELGHEPLPLALTDEERAALPKPLPQDALEGEMVLVKGLPCPVEKIPAACCPHDATPLPALPFLPEGREGITPAIAAVVNSFADTTPPPSIEEMAEVFPAIYGDLKAPAPKPVEPPAPAPAPTRHGKRRR